MTTPKEPHPADRVLSISEVHDIAQNAGLTFRAQYDRSVIGLKPPAPVQLHVRFNGEAVNVEAWMTLMSSLTEVPVALTGTRQISGSGAIDGTLFPAYREQLDVVNKARNIAGLTPVYN